MQTVNVGATTPAAQLVSAGQGTTLIANNDPLFTMWIGNSNAISASSGITTPSIPLSAGSSLVVDGKSDVFAIADPSATNAIQAIVIEGGLSFFQPFTELVVQGSTARVLIYSGVAMLGTLIGSWAAVAGVDIYGNAYPAGLNVVTQALINNATIVNASMASAIIAASQINQSTVFESTVTFDSTGGVLLMYTLTTSTSTLTALTTSWTAPAGSYTHGDVKVWGPGASGNGGVKNSYSGSGNGAGGFCETFSYPITPGFVYTTVVPQGGLGVATGVTGNSVTAATFDFTQLTGPSVRASGGDAAAGNPGGGIGGFPVVGDIGFNGGQGGAASNKSTSKSGGGGGAGGPGGQGGNGGQNGPAGSSPGGGHGGAGVGLNTNGIAGVVPGGGGSGAGYSNGPTLTSGPGGDARIVIVVNTVASTLVGAASPASGTDAAGNAYGAGFTGQINAFHPGSVPTVVETWQPVTLDSGWSAVADGLKYRLSSEGVVQVFGGVTHAAFTSGTAINASNPVPLVYRPTITRNIGGSGIPNRAGCEITAGGIFTALAGGVSCTETDVSGFYPLY
jgi:hypothetical protein